MISAFCLCPAASVRGLCDILSIIKSYSIMYRKIEKSWQEKNKPIIWGFHWTYNRSNFVLPGLPIFLIHDLVTLYYTLSISRSPLARRIPNAEIMESPRPINRGF